MQYNCKTQKLEPDPERIDKQISLTNYLIRKGAKLKDVNEFSSDFVKNNLQLIIDKNGSLPSNPERADDDVSATGADSDLS